MNNSLDSLVLLVIYTQLCAVARSEEGCQEDRVTGRQQHHRIAGNMLIGGTKCNYRTVAKEPIKVA